MKKKISLSLLTCCIVANSLLSLSVYALDNEEYNYQNLENTQNITVPYEQENQEFSYTIENENELSEYIKNNNIEILDGYSVESITIDYIIEEPPTEEYPERNARSFLMATNVSRIGSDYYFPSNPITYDWYDGPMSSVQYTAAKSITGQVSATLGASNSTLNSGLGFSITNSSAFTKTATLGSINSNQRLKVSIFGVFDKYSFDVYRYPEWNGDQQGYVGSAHAYKPMGLYIQQVTYVK